MIYYVLSPLASWVRHSSSIYTVSAAHRLTEVKGKTCEFFFETFLPFFANPRTLSELRTRFGSEIPEELLLTALEAGTAHMLLLVDNKASIPSYFDGFAALSSPNTSIAREADHTFTINFFGPKKHADRLRETVDFPCTILSYEDDQIDEFLENQKLDHGVHNKRLKDAWPTEISVVLDSSSSGIRLAKFNSLFLKLSMWWVPVRHGPSHGTVGPLIIPFQTPCFECVVARHSAASPQSQLMYTLELDNTLARSDVNNVPPSNAIISLAFGFLANELLLFFTPPSNPGLISRVIAFSQLSLGATHHKVLRVPNCPACGVASLPALHPWSSLSLTISQVMGRQEY